MRPGASPAPRPGARSLVSGERHPIRDGGAPCARSRSPSDESLGYGSTSSAPPPNPLRRRPGTSRYRDSIALGKCGGGRPRSRRSIEILDKRPRRCRAGGHSSCESRHRAPVPVARPLRHRAGIRSPAATSSRLAPSLLPRADDRFLVDGDQHRRRRAVASAWREQARDADDRSHRAGFAPSHRQG